VSQKSVNLSSLDKPILDLKPRSKTYNLNHNLKQQDLQQIKVLNLKKLTLCVLITFTVH